jgi:hypothetical protein
LATNVVMLTSLRVVHWNEGELPEGRSRVTAIDSATERFFPRSTPPAGGA